MRKKVIIALAFFVSTNLFAQIERPNRIGINFGIGTPLTNSSNTIKGKGSVNTSIDYGRAISEKFEIGLEYNQSLTAVKESEASVDVVTVGASRAFMLKSRYFITGSTYSGLYASLGVGIGKTGYAIKINGKTYSGATDNNFAYTPELGYRYKWLNASVKYLNIGGKTTDDLGNGAKMTNDLGKFQDLQFSIGVNIPF